MIGLMLLLLFEVITYISSVGQSLSFLTRCLWALLVRCLSKISPDWKKRAHSVQYRWDTFSSPPASRAFLNSSLLAISCLIWSKSLTLVFVLPPRLPIPLHEADLPLLLAFLPIKFLMIWCLGLGGIYGGTRSIDQIDNNWSDQIEVNVCRVCARGFVLRITKVRRGKTKGPSKSTANLCTDTVRQQFIYFLGFDSFGTQTN